MTALSRFQVFALVALVFCTPVALAQGSQDDSADVWATVESQWQANQKNEKGWIDRYLAAQFSGWPKNAPAPRSKASTRMWNRFSQQQREIVQHELYPLAIVVQGDVAIAHYLYSSAVKDSDDKVVVSNGRYTDTLIRSDDGWKFLSWHGGDDE